MKINKLLKAINFSMKKVYLLVPLVMLVIYGNNARAALTFNFSNINDPRELSVSGSSKGIGLSAPCTYIYGDSCRYKSSTLLRLKNSNGIVTEFYYYSNNPPQPCPAYIKSPTASAEDMQEWADTILPQQQNAFLLPPSTETWVSVDFGWSSFVCNIVGIYPSEQILFIPGGSQGIIVEPPKPVPSSCNLNNATIQMALESSSLDIEGKVMESSLYIHCTNGTPQNYTIKLLANDVLNEKLSFNNGITASVYLDNQLLKPNSSGIRLLSVSSRALPIKAIYHGTTDSSGESTVTGVLLLEAE
ncbi:hypothetical protein [Providencia rettgeri]|uniref:hypothetical protein n=1 Tax=Providencia rettgeri TaxID=587 RepID=UPI0025A87175|nr:hypothetical protein [Providencia rettgeri]ELR5245698.1 hypothetical protein [Providencia rettgeri]